ncbi:MAG: hypothetical protein ABJN69_00995 [Hellea sp.]
MKFDPYEYIGVIVPGLIVLLAASFLYPSILPMLTADITIGGLGLILILAFITGHLIQAGGNFVEILVWGLAGGMPTSWVAKAKTTLLDAEQLTRLEQRLQADFSCGLNSLKNGKGLTREIYLRLQKSGKTKMIDKFNGNYGLMRGTMIALIISAITLLVQDGYNWKGALGLFALAGIATYRMIRFGTHYAREIYVEYLNFETSEAEPAPEI